MTTMVDGSIIFDRKLPPPTDIPNYFQDTNDLHRWHPNFVKCIHRVKNVGVKPCGAISVCWFCKVKSQMITVPFCEECEYEPKT
jgi:hypothetical protein